jgi:hypothetical protein
MLHCCYYVPIYRYIERRTQREDIMTPRKPITGAPLSSTERVQKSRWINKVVKTSIELESLLDNPPKGLALTSEQKPKIPSSLLVKIAPYIDNSGDNIMKTSAVRVLKLGNGNQVRNKKIAMKYVIYHLNAEMINNKTIDTDKWGTCHVSAYTHEKGAMVSTPNRSDNEYGDAEWHYNDHIVMFRDVGNGTCKIYINDIKPLLENLTIGKGGVTWENVEKFSKKIDVIDSQSILDTLGIDGA